MTDTEITPRNTTSRHEKVISAPDEGLNFVKNEEVTEESKARDYLFTKENASEKGRRGGLIAQQNRRLRESDPNAWVLKTLQKAQPDLVQALLDASGAKGDWEALSVDKRLYAVIKALEYSYGKPLQAERAEELKAAEGHGLSIV